MYQIGLLSDNENVKQPDTPLSNSKSDFSFNVELETS